MKIYFTGSLHGGVGKDVYGKIVGFLEKIGHKVMSDHILKMTTGEIDNRTHDQRLKYHRKMNKMITSCDLVVCEVSFPSSISIGHEVTLALDKGRPVVALYQPGKEPGVLQGVKSDRFLLFEYTEKDLDDILDYAVEEAVEKVDIRFNFFISPMIGQYLDHVSKKKKTPRAVYLRRLIEKDMKKNTEYSD
ncbi:hypothetical protein ACFL1M_00400 [Patescibacteria group bacterium]